MRKTKAPQKSQRRKPLKKNCKKPGKLSFTRDDFIKEPRKLLSAENNLKKTPRPRAALSSKDLDAETMVKIIVELAIADYKEVGRGAVFIGNNNGTTVIQYFTPDGLKRLNLAPNNHNPICELMRSYDPLTEYIVVFISRSEIRVYLEKI